MKFFRIVYTALAALLLCGCYDHKVSELGMAVADGDMEKVRQLVENGVNVNGCSGYEGCERPLEVAARYGRLEYAKFLVAHGAKINAGDINAVYWAALNGKADVVHYLLSKDGRLVCDKAALASLKRDMTAKGWTQLYAEVEKTWVAP